MSVSLYYTAKRPHPITHQEQNSCSEIAERYDKQYPFGELYEDFCIYDDVLIDAEWTVHLDDMSFKWSVEEHCFLPDL